MNARSRLRSKHTHLVKSGQAVSEAKAESGETEGQQVYGVKHGKVPPFLEPILYGVCLRVQEDLERKF